MFGASVQHAKRPEDVMEIENNRLNDRHSAKTRLLQHAGRRVMM